MTYFLFRVQGLGFKVQGKVVQGRLAEKEKSIARPLYAERLEFLPRPTMAEGDAVEGSIYPKP